MVDMETTDIKIHDSTLAIPLVLFLGKRDGIVREPNSHKYSSVHGSGLNMILPLEGASMPTYIERAKNYVNTDNDFPKKIVNMRLWIGRIETFTLQNNLSVEYKLETYDGNPSNTHLRSNVVKHYYNFVM